MELVKTYENISIFGHATLILTGWSDGNYYFCEWLLNLEGKNIFLTSDERIRTKIEPWRELKNFFGEPKTDEELLILFMQQVKISAEGKLFGWQVEIIEDKNLHQHINNDLSRENDFISTIIFLKSKFPDYFKTLQKRSNSRLLLEAMKIADGITYLPFSG